MGSEAQLGGDATWRMPTKQKVYFGIQVRLQKCKSSLSSRFKMPRSYKGHRVNVMVTGVKSAFGPVRV